MDTNDRVLVTWKINSFDLVSFKVEETVAGSIFDAAKINFQISLSINLTPEEKLVQLNCTVEIYSNETHDTLLGAIQTKAEFTIVNMNDFNTDGKVHLPGEILGNLFAITISSTRGMLSLLSRGTVFEKAVLPIIDPSLFLKNYLRK